MNVKHKKARLFRTFGTESSGTVAVEFGALLPVFILLLLGVIEASLAISTGLTGQAAVRAGTYYGLIKKPTNGDMTGVIAAAKAAMPSEWTGNNDEAALVTAALVCECAVSGAVACGGSCGNSEAKHKFLQVNVSKIYQPLISTRFFTPSFQMTNQSLVRLE